MNNEEFFNKVILILVDKGLLAIIFVIAGLFASKSLEKYKNLLNWKTELLNERMKISKDLINTLREIEEAYFSLSFNMLYYRNTFPKEFWEKPRKILVNQSKVAQLLFPNETVKFLGDVLLHYDNIVGNSKMPQIPRAELTERTKGNGMNLALLRPEEEKWRKNEVEKMKTIIALTINSMQKCFPNQTYIP